MSGKDGYTCDHCQTNEPKAELLTVKKSTMQYGDGRDNPPTAIRNDTREFCSSECLVAYYTLAALKDIQAYAVDYWRKRALAAEGNQPYPIIDFAYEADRESR